ncbi:unnamed protein product [Rhizophagus irregularis]|nr:unnamed protein product [Rhizophagus irregularis]
MMTLNFHIVKRRYNQIGYVHFSNQFDCKKFYDEMKEQAHKGPKDTIIEFIHDVKNDENDYQPVPYRVYEKE